MRIARLEYFNDRLPCLKLTRDAHRAARSLRVIIITRKYIKIVFASANALRLDINRTAQSRLFLLRNVADDTQHTFNDAHTSHTHTRARARVYVCANIHKHRQVCARGV